MSVPFALSRRASVALCAVIAVIVLPCAAFAQDDDGLGLELEGSVEAEASSESEEALAAEGEGELADAPPEEPAEADDAAPLEEPAAELEQASDTGAPAEAPEAAPQRAISLYMAAGLGVGSLGFTRPIAVGVQLLPESTFAAAELVLRLHAWPSETFSLETQLVYQTSLSFELEIRPLFALPERVDVRVQRIDLSVAPRFALSSSQNGLAIAIPVGFTLRSFFAEVHEYSVETHNLGSVLVRPELILPLGDLITLRVGPEAHWLMLIEPSLEREGVSGSGYAYGFQGLVQAAVGPTFSVALAYRQLHSVIPSAARFEDTERFLTARFGGSL